MKKMDKKEVARLWVEYKRTQAKEYFDTIVEVYLPLVRYTAERIWGKLPERGGARRPLQRGRLWPHGGRSTRSTSSRGVKFETYCTPRIRGAILDQLRSEDWVPRLVRSPRAPGRAGLDAPGWSSGRNPTEERDG